MSGRAPTAFAISPDYGQGVARRRIRLTSLEGAVLAELEDHSHAMRCRLSHADGRITAVESEFHRFPLTTCPGAAQPVAELVGEPIGQSTRDFFAGGRARRNCTHMLDLAWLAARHAAREAAVRLYEIDVPDTLDGRTRGSVRRDGTAILEWTIDADTITDPAPFAGRHLFKGFVTWLLDQPDIDDEQAEAALMLQKACLITAARKLILPPGPLGDGEKQAVVGLCYGFGPERIEQAVRREGQIRDFTDHPENLLKFL